MKKLLWTAVMSTAILALSGCGGGSTKEVVKDAAFYKESYKKATSIEALNTEDTVLFTMSAFKEALNDPKVVTKEMDEATKLSIVQLFEESVEDSISNIENYISRDDVPIILPRDQSKAPSTNGNPVLDFNSTLKSATSDCECCDPPLPCMIIVEFIHYVEEYSDVDIKNDVQTYLGVPQKDDFLSEFNGGVFVEVQAYRDAYNKEVDKRLP